MKPADDREEVLFREVLQRPKGSEREAFLDHACAGNAALRGRLAALLQAHENPDPFLEPPAAAPAKATVRLPLKEGPGTLIGRYKRLEQIGEGGFGFVYVAEQRESLKRRAALKIIKLGMNGAVEFAAKAVAAINRKVPVILDTLAAACAEAGEFAKAVGAQQEAVALLPEEVIKKDYHPG